MSGITTTLRKVLAAATAPKPRRRVSWLAAYHAARARQRGALPADFLGDGFGPWQSIGPVWLGALPGTQALATPGTLVNPAAGLAMGRPVRT